MMFEIKDTGTKGLGAFATAKITPGTLIHSEKPLVRIPRSYYMKADIEEAFNQLPVSEQTAYLNLTSAHGQDPQRYPRGGPHPSLEAEEKRRIIEQHEARTGKEATLLSRFMTNAMECGKGAAVFEVASRFNHSCVPNACFSWNEKLGMETIYAVKDIESGDVCCNPSSLSSQINQNRQEITVSYCDPYLDVSMRMFELWHYGFECDCPACGDTRIVGSFAAKSRDRRWRLREIDDWIFLDDKEKLKAKVEAVAVIKEEGLLIPRLGEL